MAGGNANRARHLVEAASRYSSVELEDMLRGLFEADLAIKVDNSDEAAVLASWLGQHLLATRASRGES